MTIYSRPGDYDKHEVRGVLFETLQRKVKSATDTGDVDFDGTLDAGEITTFENTMDSLKRDFLAEAKAQNVEKLDTKTDELIAAGFTYSTKQFSLSEKAQLKIIGGFVGKDILSYPVTWNTIDDGDTYDVADAPDMVAFYTAAMNATKGHLDSGTALKDSVRAAATPDDVWAVVDGR